MRNRSSLCLVSFMLSVAYASAALSAPVTAEDLTGKTICWENSAFGHITDTYGEGGKFSGSGGDGAWVVTPDGVKLDTEGWSLVENVQKLPDGTFTDDVTIGGRPVHSTGKYCSP
jgi:hypothetical protein